MAQKITIELEDSDVSRLDRYRGGQENPPSRTAALRHLALSALMASEIEAEAPVAPKRIVGRRLR